MNVFRHNRGTRWLLYGVTAGLYLFIFVPIAVVIYGSFDANEVLSFPYRQTSLRWYREFLASRLLLTSIANSVLLGLAASLGAVVLGTLAALVIVRFRVPGQRGLELLLISPMVVSKVRSAISARNASAIVQASSTGVPGSVTTKASPA